MLLNRRLAKKLKLKKMTLPEKLFLEIINRFNFKNNSDFYYDYPINTTLYNADFYFKKNKNRIVG